jgi:hypothetical protein
MSGVDAPSHSEVIVHSTEAVKSPPPTAETAGTKLVNPEIPPAGVFGAEAMLTIVEPGKLSLKRKSSLPPFTDSLNLIPGFSTTSTLTDVPLCVSVTTKSEGPARLTPGKATLATSRAAPTNPLRHDKDAIIPLHFCFGTDISQMTWISKIEATR